MPPKKAIKKPVKQIINAAKKAKEDAINKLGYGTVSALDSFSNVMARIGFGTPNLLEATEYPLTRLTQNYNLMNSLYRSHWIVRKVIDTIPQDMCKNWYEFTSQVSPEQIDSIQKAERQTKTRQNVLAGLKWGRLYGGAAGVMLIDGQEDYLSEPLDLDSIMPGQYRGIYIRDRWSGVYPSSTVIQDINDPNFGYPESYNFTTETGDLLTVHNSRVIRFTGRSLPYWEKLAEVHWGLSEVEIIYDELKKRDNTSWNIASLIFMANVRILKMADFGEMLAFGTKEVQSQLYSTLEAQNHILSNMALQIIGKDDDFDMRSSTAFSGLSDMYESFMMDIAGASEYPVTKLFGRSPSGLNATGEHDSENYQGTIHQNQETHLRPVIEQLLPILCMSTWGYVPDDIDVRFKPYRSMNNKEMADLASNKGKTIIDTYNSGLISQKVAMQELRQMSDETGMFTNITDEDIEAADATISKTGELMPDMPKFKSSFLGTGIDEEWNEADHPRKKGGKNAGQFTRGETSGTIEKPAHKGIPAWNDLDQKAQEKYRRIQKLNKQFDAIQNQNNDNLGKDERAECIALIMSTGIRPGSEKDTHARKKAYGATTLEGRHVIEENGKVYLRFVGKKGVDLNIPVTDPKVAAILLNRKKNAGENGRLFSFRPDKLIDYTHTLDGGEFKTKDFRTRVGTTTAKEIISITKPPPTFKEYKKQVMSVARQVSQKLGNTPVIALQAYIDPTVFVKWRKAING